MDDLWGTLPAIVDNNYPLTVLKEQSELIKKKTRNAICGYIECGIVENSVVVSFYMSWTGYRFKLLEYQYRLDSDGYPGKFMLGGAERVVASDESFCLALSDILKSINTVSVLNSLMSLDRIMENK